MIVGGIDPGGDGAMARFDGEQLYTYCFRKVKADQGRGTEILYLEACNEFNIMFSDCDHFYIERVGAMPRQGGSSMFKFGYSAGFVRALPTMCEIPVTMVLPNTWKKGLGIGTSDKSQAMARAMTLFPKFADQFTPRRGYRNAKQCEGAAEAALISYYGRQQLIKETP